MRYSIFITLLFLVSITSCSDDDDKLSQEQEAENLNEIFSEIENLALSEGCENSFEWTFTNYGSKACGGSIGFIAYSVNIDVEFFLELIEEHREKQEDFNEKWEIISDCSIPAQPTGVICEDGNPVLQY